MEKSTWNGFHFFSRYVAVMVALLAHTWLFSEKALAGEWVITYSYSGQQSWTQDDMSSDPMPWGPNGEGRMVAVAGRTLSAQTEGTVTATLTWQADDPNDRPPAKIMVYQKASATWFVSYMREDPTKPASASYSGNASNGLSSPKRDSGQPPSLFRADAVGVKVIVKTLGPTENSFQLPAVQQSARLSGSCSNGLSEGRVSLSYTVSVIEYHAHPTNFREIYRRANEPAEGELTFQYDWESTDGGARTNLGNCLIGEWVSYDGNPAPPGEYRPNQGQYTDLPIAYGYYLLPKPHYGPGDQRVAYKNPH